MLQKFKSMRNLNYTHIPNKEREILVIMGKVEWNTESEMSKRNWQNTLDIDTNRYKLDKFR